MKTAIRYTYLSVFVLVMGIFVSGNAYAVVTFTGSLSTSTESPNPSPAGLTGTGIWADDFLISWKVEQVGSNWKYEYKLSENSGDVVEPGGISHWIFEVSPNITEDNYKDNFWNFKADGVDVADNKIEFDDFTGSQGNSNPGLIGTLHGIKMDLGATMYSFFSTRAPVWGDFYSKNGRAGGKGQNAIWNSGTGSADPTGAPQNGLLSDGNGGYHYKILRPDTTTDIPGESPEVPEPTTVALLSLGLIGYAYSRRKRS